MTTDEQNSVFGALMTIRSRLPSRVDRTAITWGFLLNHLQEMEENRV